MSPRMGVADQLTQLWPELEAYELLFTDSQKHEVCWGLSQPEGQHLHALLYRPMQGACLDQLPHLPDSGARAGCQLVLR